MEPTFASASRANGHTFLIRPPAESAAVKDLAKRCQAAAEQAGLVVTTYRAVNNVLIAEGAERRAALLETSNAAGLYRAMHRERVLVLAFTSVFVRRDPSRSPAVRRAALRLESFVAHKSVFGLVRGRQDVAHHFDRFDAWCMSVCCGGEDDPRVLPLHTFRTSRDWCRLDEPQVAGEFARLYGAGSSRRDEDGQRWRRANALHGRDALTVAGRVLVTGMHWDVQAEGSRTRLCTSDAVWLLERNAYVNVYPDGVVRRPKRAVSARQVWPAQRRLMG